MEIWKEYRSGYFVSNLGNVRGKKGDVLKPDHSRSGYERIFFYEDGQLRKRVFIHRLVYESFNGAIPEGFIVDHIDNNRKNNRLDNLQILTKQGNTLKYYREDRYKTAA